MLHNIYIKYIHKVYLIYITYVIYIKIYIYYNPKYITVHLTLL